MPNRPATCRSIPAPLVFAAIVPLLASWCVATAAPAAQTARTATGTAPAASAPRPLPVVEAPPPGSPAEPAVQRTVIDDSRARVDELRVRGEVRRIVVTPKNGAKPYEILPADAGRDMAPSHGSQRGAAGQRVWNVLDF